MVAGLLLPPGLNAIGGQLAPKGADLLLHFVIAWLEDKYKSAVSRADAP
jgi:hypothetical protein